MSEAKAAKAVATNEWLDRVEREHKERVRQWVDRAWGLTGSEIGRAHV